MITHQTRVFGGILATACAAMAVSVPAQAEAPGQVDRYIVGLQNQSEVAALTASLPDGVVKVQALTGKAFNGLVVKASDATAEALSRQPGVTSVERDSVVTASDVPSWGTDRIDQRDLPLDGTFRSSSQGAGTHVYVIDTGITETSILKGRVGPGVDFVADGYGTEDCYGHGTHVAGTIAGTGGFGVASQATVHPVRVLDCDGSGWVSDVIQGYNWVAAHAPAPSVANASLGGDYSASENAAADALVGSGTPFAVSAGNDATDACGQSPASAPRAITVGATTKTDDLAYFSNFGNCVDILAPGAGISSMVPGDEVESWSGTSMASPHVAGTLATYFALHPTASAAAAEKWLKEQSTPGRIKDLPPGTPNKLVFASSEFGPADSAPGLVTGLHLTSVTHAQAALAWSNPADSDLASVIVRRVEGSKAPTNPTHGTAVRLSAPTAQSTVDSGLKANTQYSYAVFTQDAAGNLGEAPATISVLTKRAPVGKPGRPGRVHTSRLTRTSVKAGWAPASGQVDQYAVAIRAKGANAWQSKGSTEGRSLSVKGLRRGHRYQLRVMAQNKAGSGPAAYAVIKTRR